MVVRVTYVFGLARATDGRDEIVLDVPGGTTVFQVMQRLGVSRLEIHAAVNGTSAADGTVLRDGDQVTLIPAIQGGRGGGAVMRALGIGVTGAVIGLAVALGAAVEAGAQARVVAPGRGPVVTRGGVAPGVAGVPSVHGGGAGVPASSQDVRIVTPGRPDTRIIIQEPTTGGGTGGPGVRSGGGAAGSISARETRIIVEESAGPGLPPTRRETRIRVEPGSGPPPPVIIVVPE